MGRGPGKWQRMILEALEAKDFVIICDLLPEDAKRAEQSALNRAAKQLYRKGDIDLDYARRDVSVKYTKGIYKVPRVVLVALRPGVNISFRIGDRIEGSERIPLEDIREDIEAKRRAKKDFS